MKYILFIVLAIGLYGECHAQNLTPRRSDKTIGTSVDTLLLSKKDLNIVELSITNWSLVDTLRWKTDNDAGWSLLMPLQTFHADNIYAKYIYRWAPYTATNIFTQLTAN